MSCLLSLGQKNAYSHNELDMQKFNVITWPFWVQEIENDEESDVSSDEEGDEGEPTIIAVSYVVPAP